MAQGALRVGTSGWNYGDWKGVFYPESLKSAEYLTHYARHFDTTEINYTFYHLPRPSTYEKWASQTPEGFLFAVKASRVITHVKRLSEVAEAWQKFLESALRLGPKLGPVLLQLPPSMRADKTRLEAFLRHVCSSPAKQEVLLAFEFRHATWFDPEICELLQRYGATLVIAHSERYPQAPATPTAPFVYLRFHGPGALFASKYPEEQLQEWAERIRRWRAEGRTVFAYFNNDYHGYAIENARRLRELIAPA
ncbi:MAG: DUF72 domain-containing protein [Bryobacteraceae bacterium]|nr:DUF72 domain-containing protein [Bryobacteraceae bacterium]